MLSYIRSVLLASLRYSFTRGDFMHRSATKKLIAWKNDPQRKPLIIKGARQVGKTWLMHEFGKNYYADYVYYNFDEEDELKSIFDINKNPNRIV